MDKFIFDMEIYEIDSELENKNNIINVTIINKPNNIKITFSNIYDADKFITDGLVIFSRYFPGNQLPEDMYVILFVCHK